MKKESKISLKKITIAKIQFDGMNKIKGGSSVPSHMRWDESNNWDCVGKEGQP